MTTKTEGRHTGEFVVSEANGTLSRETKTVTVPAETTLEAGTVLGEVTADKKFVVYDDAETDGREDAAGVLYETIKNEATSAADIEATVIVRHAEVRRDDLVFATGTTDADKNDAFADLRLLEVIPRPNADI